MPPWVFDIIVIAILLLSAVMSIGRGLIRETFSILAFVVGGIAAYLCITLFSDQLKQLISPNEESVAPQVILFLVGFLVAYAAAAFLGTRLSRLFNDSPEIGIFDRLAGAFLGLIKGAFACVLFVVLMHQVIRVGEEPPWIAKSQSYPLLSGAAGLIGGGVTGVIHLFTGPDKPTSAQQTSQ